MADKTSPLQTPIPAAATSLVHALIHEHAHLFPDSEAVLSWDCTFTYTTLDLLSSRLTRQLLQNGVGPEVIVPLLFEKSGWALVAVLAVMKAGGAFMPLDISQPEERLRSIVEQTGAKVALSSTSCYELCSSLCGITITVTNNSIKDLGASSGELWSQCPVESHNAAYVMATSGSTGTPKLVVTEHSQLSSFVAYLTRPLGFSNNTRAFQFASYAFDPIIGDIFLTLCAGGTVCIPSEDERKNDLVGAMSRMHVNLAKFTPSLVNSLADTLTPETVPTLRTLILGGETASSAVIKYWADKVDLKLIYGSTECTISCVVDDASTRAIAPGEIGRPVGSRERVVKLDNYHHLADDGEVGELLLEGPLVSRGYLNNPSQTEAKYISLADPSNNSTRLYRTGDLVRSLRDRRLIYVGRVDNQVKIRGQRLELEDAEQHVRRTLSRLHDQRVKDVLVDFAAPRGTSSKQLVAIVSIESVCPLGSLVLLDGTGAVVDISHQTQQEFGTLVSELESALKAVVPLYMVPTLWVPIQEMPYTLSRKRDRQRLRKAIESLPASELAAFCRVGVELLGGETVDVLSEKEKLLQILWSRILERDPPTIRPTDNFFYIGGNSLSVLRLISMLRETSYRLTADSVFQCPQLRDMASKLTSSSPNANKGDELGPFALIATSDLQSIQQEAARQCGLNLDTIEDILPLYSMQHHYITGYPELGRSINGPWDWQQQIVFLLPPGFDVPRFQSVWQNLIQRHSQLRTRVVKTSNGLFQVTVHPDHGPAWQELSDLDAYVRQDQVSTMTFGDELLRLTIVKSNQQSFFVMTMQHLIYDAFSREILFTELEAGYMRRDLPETRSPKMSQFIQYFTREADRASAIEFWTSYLDEAVTRPFLSRSLGTQPVGELMIHEMTFAKPQLTPTSKYTLATVIEVSAALAIAHMQLEISNTERSDCPRDVIFYSDRAGRNLPVDGLSDLVAPTTLFLPLRVHIDLSQPVHELLSCHHAAGRDMIPHEDMNWTELREMSHLREVLRHSVNININPYTPLRKLGSGMGLKVVGEHEKCDDPFGINVSIGEDEVEWVLYYDQGFVDGDVVRDLAQRVGVVFLLLGSGVEEETRMTVNDVLRHVEKELNM